MKLIVIVGSNRTNGVSSRVVSLIRHHLEGRASVEDLWLRDYRIDYCDADNACSKTDCSLSDDVALIVDEMVKADAILYLPVMHAYGANSRFQAFLERVGYGFLRPRERPLRDKLAAVAVVGRRYGHTAVFGQVVLNVLLNKMVLVGSGFPATFNSQLVQDPEAEQALRETLDRLVEHYQKLNERPRHGSEHLRLLKQVQFQTG
ncbi:FMN reductase [Pseudomonas syringae pv. syringae]|uniref:flavodoxin family protein n=1 Tax=Pseudomonas syringae TaxID=317 RepID=UPI0007AEB6B1|nr:flavodoxin family protein [Pseudomonas syringae]KZL42398.1 FMN reductase [Pseudomonas syringae pv. syringae]